MPQKAALRDTNRTMLFCFTTLFYWASLYTYSPILAAYVKNLGASNKMAGIIIGSYGFTQMLFRIPLGIASDKLRRRRMFITFGIFFSLFSSVGLLLFRNLTVILLFRSLAGAAAATWVDFTVLYTSYYRREDSVRAIGTLNFFNNFGQTSAMFFGGLVADSFGWSASFDMGIVLAAVGIILSRFIVENRSEPEPAKAMKLRDFLEVAKDRRLISVSVLAVLSQSITFATVFGFTPVYAAASLHSGKLAMSLLTVFASLPSAFSALIAGSRLAPRFGEKKVIMAGFAIAGVFTITIPFTHSYLLLILTQVAAGFGRGMSFPLLMGLSIRDVPMERRSTAMGFFQSVYGLGMFAGPVIMGGLADLLSLQMGFVLFGIFGLLIVPATQLMIGRQKNPARI